MACGGSGGSDDTGDGQAPTTVQPLLVNAGTNLTLNEDESADLVGGSSGGSGAITFTWQAPSQVQITHTDTSVANATVLAPSTTQVQQYTLTLRASDAAGNEQSDTITLNVNPVNEPPLAIITTNQITPYAERSYPTLSTITLDAGSSTDPDPMPNIADIAEYRWQQISGPNLLAGVDTSQAIISVITPILEQETQAQFRLNVTDQEQTTSSTDISLVLLAQSQTIPVVTSVPIKNVFSGELVHLSASASSLAPDASPFNAIWMADTPVDFIDDTQFITAAISPLVQQNTSLTYQISVEDSFFNEVIEEQTVQVYAPVPKVFNDTGIVHFADSQSTSTQYQVDYPGQDAAYGSDRQNASGQVTKVGQGENGFDFTRLDNNGDPILEQDPNSDPTYSCVRDNVTGLVWQIKSNIDVTSINYVDQKVTWFSEEENGNFEGAQNEDSTSCNQSSGQCNTQAYTQALNSEGLCGFFDWRLPSPSELQSIIHYGKSAPPMVDTAFFPFWASNADGPLWYWTSQSSADGVSDDIARNAWAFDMNTGNDGFVNKLSEQRIVLVRAGR
jgi:hypothetical protein